MIGKIFITSSGYDPQYGKHVKDPYLGDMPSIGACRPDIRKKLSPGDHIFVISGKIRGNNQFVMGGFEIAEKMDAMEAYFRFPEQRLRRRSDGEMTGNIITDAQGEQHSLDNHNKFYDRLDNYIIGRNPVALVTPEEIQQGRDETLEALQHIFQRSGPSPIKVVGRCSNLTEDQVICLRTWLEHIKRPTG